ncbi:hypothetical protein FGO68_gene12223 [Halteria grandinella]|uniref:Uncharacterized protein n=1 Tax=Halteria grandinella TaxID=5974 RepID=A0A8J8NMM5_HALGN|nr:hypothetical protein FGO68_gene12223 [Halteria grandinella]
MLRFLKRPAILSGTRSRSHLRHRQEQGSSTSWLQGSQSVEDCCDEMQLETTDYRATVALESAYLNPLSICLAILLQMRE